MWYIYYILYNFKTYFYVLFIIYQKYIQSAMYDENRPQGSIYSLSLIFYTFHSHKISSFPSVICKEQQQ